MPSSRAKSRPRAGSMSSAPAASRWRSPIWLPRPPPIMPSRNRPPVVAIPSFLANSSMIRAVATGRRARGRRRRACRHSCREIPGFATAAMPSRWQLMAAGESMMQVDIEHAINDLTIGPGYARLEGFYSPEQTAEARRLVYQLAESEPHRTTHFLGNEKVPTQKRVWNLIEKGRVFQDIASDERLLAIIEGIVGDVRLASFAANVLFPGAPAQEPHVDYPYWDMHRPERFPRGLNASFFLEVELLVMLDDFTLENGATALMPHSHHRAEWPNVAEFDHKSVRIVGPAGTLLLFPALTWHAGQANRGKRWRAALLGAYTAKFVKPLEDWERGVSPATRESLSPRMAHLLGFDDVYPAVMDE